MAAPQKPAEPSMEEILASIRRIISEDDKASQGGQEPQEEALELSQTAPDVGGRAVEKFDDLMVFEEEEAPAAAPYQPPSEPPRAPPAALAAEPEARRTAPIDRDDLMISEPAAAAAAKEFTRLVGGLRIAEQPGQTLEGVVRDLLRPMLKEWLDKNLPAIVEAKVEAELERIVRLAR